MLERLGLVPPQASTLAGRVDALYGFLIGVSIFFAVLVSLALVLFVVRYRARPENPRAAQIEGSPVLEIVWTTIPFAIAMTLFVWGASVYLAMARPPEDALEIFVVGKQWMWKVQHVEGNREINELHVPVGQAIKLTMTSEDVIHSFYVPAFRVKADVLPDRFTKLWFEATKPGTYHLFCTEYCGTLHSLMIGKVIAMEPSDYQAWLEYGAGGGSLKKTASLAARGRAAFEKHSCITCHRDYNAPLQAEIESAVTGPPLMGLYGSKVELADGSSAVADDAYLRQSILDPMAHIVLGYPAKMPTYRGRVTPEELVELIAYIRSLAEVPRPSKSTDPTNPREHATRS